MVKHLMVVATLGGMLMLVLLACLANSPAFWLGIMVGLGGCVLGIGR